MRLSHVCVFLFAALDLSTSTINNEATDISESAEHENRITTDENVSTSKLNENNSDKSRAIWDEEGDKIGEKGKRYGFVLGKGFSYGKRFGSFLGKGMSFGKRFGSVLGNGISFGKRFGTAPGNGMNFDKRYGSVLGKGYSFGKRENFGQEDFDHLVERAGNEHAISELDEDHSADKRNLVSSIDKDLEIVDLAGPVDEKKWVLNDIFGGGFSRYKRSKRDTRTKRYIHYFGNVLGRGFSMGKREDNPVIDNLSDGMESLSASENSPVAIDVNSGDMDNDNHFYSAVNGPGYIIGKRQKSYGRDLRRYFGSVLGRGFSFGKRNFEADHKEINGNDNSVPENLKRAFPNSEIGTEQPAIGNENFSYKRYFLSSPGSRFGKRDMEERDKRFGFILGRGLFGKRQPLPPKRKRPYGFVLGRGYSFGKRSSENTDDVPYEGDMYTAPDFSPEFNRRASFVLGGGYMLGKRGDKRFGQILGSGLSFGKRDGTDEHHREDVSLFIDDFGNTFVRTDQIEGFDKMISEDLVNTEARVFVCTGRLIPHQSDNTGQLQKSRKGTAGSLDLKKRATTEEVSYFIDDAGNIYVKADDLSGDDKVLIDTSRDNTYYTCDGHMTEILEDNFYDENISKRGWGNVLGGGFQFGKRFGSKKRFGHILGNGFSFGK